jgi:hypothetical protein
MPIPIATPTPIPIPRIGGQHLAGTALPLRVAPPYAVVLCINKPADPCRTSQVLNRMRIGRFISTFRWKDYRQRNKQKLMTLKAEEFIRRFLLHVLPSGFVRIRHFGFLANRHREIKLSLCLDLLGVPQADPPQSSTAKDWKILYETLTGRSFTLCPACRQGQMITVEILPPQKQPQGIDSS